MRDAVKYSLVFGIIYVLLVQMIFVSLASAESGSSVSQSYQPSNYAPRMEGYRGSSSYATSQDRPGYQTYYGDRASTYWPVLGDRETCEARQDLLLQVAPAGCKPAVVRSDLLEEQNVPVFCQIDAVKINPLVDIDQIRNIGFTRNYPPEVVDVGFHPARAALRTHDMLLGSPLVNNIGYVVVVLRRVPNESSMPSSVNLTLNAQMEYVSGNSLGIGRAEFVLTPVSDEEWKREKYKQSFWNGRYFLRLDEVDSNFAIVSIYFGERRVLTTRVRKGQISEIFYLPGMYCRAGLQVSFDDFIASQKKARIEVWSPEGSDIFEVYEGSRFLDDRCVVSSIEIDENGETGKVIGSCGRERFSLVLKPRVSDIFSVFSNGSESAKPKEERGSYIIDLNFYSDYRKGVYELDSNNQLKIYSSGEGGQTILVYSDGRANAAVSGRNSSWDVLLHKALLEYKIRKSLDPNYDIGGILDKSLKREILDKVIDAIEEYERVADNYPAERREGIEGIPTFGEEALERAIILARDAGLDSTRARLLNKYLELYPNSVRKNVFSNELNSLYKIDNSLAGAVVDLEDKSRTIRLVSVKDPSRKARAYLLVGNKAVSIGLRETLPLVGANSEVFGNITLDEVSPEYVRVSAYCNRSGQGGSSYSRHMLNVAGSAESICDFQVKLEKVDVERVAKIRLIPYVGRGYSEANFSINIGIEKRAIKLNPDTTLERINRLNETIKKWEDISNKLGKVVSGLKAACFATAAVLSFKNFFSGLNGQTLARQEVMRGENGWRSKCEKMYAEGKYSSLDACFTANANEIDADVNAYSSALQRVNNRIQSIQSKYTTNNGLFGRSVDTEKVREALAQEARANYGNMKINMSRTPWFNDKTEISVNELLTEDNVRKGLVSTDAIRTIMLQGELQKSGKISSDQQARINSRLTEVAEMTHQNMVISRSLEQAEQKRSLGFGSPFYVDVDDPRTRLAETPILSETNKKLVGFGESVTHTATVVVPSQSTLGGRNGKDINFSSGTYLLGLSQADERSGLYVVREVFYEEAPGKYRKIESVGDFSSVYGISYIRSSANVRYTNEIVPADRKVRFYENEPYKGMPAIVPFDIRNGWYAATRQNLPVFGGIGAFDASGRATSFYVCNVGNNGRIDIENGFGDDICQLVNTITGQPDNVFPGLDQQQSRRIIRQAQIAIEDAARQYGQGNRYVRINGEQMEVGRPSAGKPGTQCQDFMSPRDCHILFNVCDPVICPPSRCDLGGTYPVADVVQTGIIGSIFLCLPNIREGIFIPVCLTGIKAGIDGLISIMKNHRDCLQEHLKTGRMVALCDQLYSIYLCEFLWRQVAPFLNILIPKIIEMAYGQGTRGGAEYLTVQSAWQNMENSVNYFTNNYAVNSFKNFRMNNLGEAGTEVCKVFFSVKAPKAFEQLIEPDSPPQFHAWFDSIRMNDATLPATAHYKVFYHIFAGKGQGVYYSVYLRNPPTSSYYAMQPTITVAYGFAPQGEYRSETKDFTAPEGYRELCVRINENEECGFKQVSTSFAVNYLRDFYVKNQMTKTDITSERECISGSPDVGAVFANTNPQSAFEEAALPAVYNRGVIRICASQNPGLGSDPSRFVDVGYCDDPKLRCWLDKRSVDNAITKNNLYLRDKTLAELENETLRKLEQSGEVLTRGDAQAEIRSLRKAAADLKKARDKQSAAKPILDRIELVKDKFIYNQQKAELQFLKAEVLEIVARDAYSKEKSDAVSNQGGSGGGSSQTPSNNGAAPTNQQNTLPEIFKGVQPYYDSQARLVINYSGGVGAYGLSVEDKLEKYDYISSAWVNAESQLGNVISDLNGKSLSDLKNALSNYKRLEIQRVSNIQISGVSFEDVNQIHRIQANSQSLIDIARERCGGSGSAVDSIFDLNKNRLPSLRIDSALPNDIVLLIPRSCRGASYSGG